MRIYDADQEGMFFLSPYVQVSILSDRLQMLQTLYSYETSLLCEKSDAERFLDLLANGIKEEKLYNVLKKSVTCTEADRLIKLWILMGVIE